MADITHLHPMPAVKLLLKGKDHDHLADIFFDLLYASGAPGPYLRADEIEDRNAQAMQFARQAQVEVREIDHDGGVRLAPRGFCDQMLETAANSRKMGHD